MRTSGELGVAEDVLLGERLLDQEQVERRRAGEMRGVAQRVGGVGVDLERDVVAEQLAHGRTGSMSQPGSILSLIRT